MRSIAITSRLVTLLVLVTTACGQPPAADEPQPSNPQVITADEIEQSRAPNAYEAIAKLRKNFFSNRGSVTLKQSISPLPVVFVDGSEYGDLQSLRDIPAMSVASIRMYRAWESTIKFGSTKTSGVIEVITKNH